MIPIDYNLTQGNKEVNLDKLALKAHLDENGEYNDTLCNVFRAGITSKQKTSTYGFLATFLSCSVIVGFTEQPCSEGSKCTHNVILPAYINE